MRNNLMRTVMLLRTPRTPADIFGTFSIALFPFWRFDAKGGEVDLLGFSVGICMGRAQACAFIIY